MASAAAACSGAAAGRIGGGAAVALVGAVVVGTAVRVRSRRSAILVVGVIAVAGALSGWAAVSRERVTMGTQVPAGPARLAGRIVEEPGPTAAGVRFLFEPTHRAIGGGWEPWRGPRIAVYAADAGGGVAGDRVVVAGTLRAAPDVVRGDPVAGRLTGGRVLAVDPAADPLFAVGNAMRRRIIDRLSFRAGDPGAGLLAGFLIGDVSGLPAADALDLRLAGLTHFVAVSGSNVALFLGAWWLVIGPLGYGARRRAVLGLAGLAVFTVVTRWEPSVVRAATMAGLVLGGAAAGVPVDAWTALGGAVTLLVLVSGQLVADVGFQLSVAATAGVLAGAGIVAGRRPSWAWSALGATAAAQVAVAPLLLVHFGTVPLLSPVANLAAAPLVAAATAAGGAGVLAGIDPLVGIGVSIADAVLGIARLAAGWPQLGPAALTVTLAIGALALRPRLRPFVVFGAAATALVVALPAGPPDVARAVFLDVGQGDAILLQGTSGETILVDGGPDPGRLSAALRRYDVDHVDLLVLTHRHADHLDGVAGLVDRIPVGEIWHSPDPDRGDVLPGILEAARDRGIPTRAPGTGEEAMLGDFRLQVLGPGRRYDSPNDGSLVLLVTGPRATLLLPGDIETVAQAELGPVPADVMKVPHQGAATSDPAWLAASAGSIAVITVGPNDYGHPSADVVATLVDAGAHVLRTDRDGDVVIPLG